MVAQTSLLRSEISALSHQSRDADQRAGRGPGNADLRSVQKEACGQTIANDGLSVQL